MLRTDFANNSLDAEKYDGFLLQPDLFVREFPYSSSMEETLEAINNFLISNGYNAIAVDEWDDETGYDNENVSVRKNSYKESLVLFVKFSKYDLTDVIKDIVEFRNERDWEQFHNSKDLAIAISLEANELLELFLWKDNEDFNKERLEEELADVFTYGLLLAEKHGLNVAEIISRKVKRNAEKYPVSKAKGSAKKYDEL